MSLRPVTIQPGFLSTAPSCLISCGGTRVLCTATVQEGVPPFLRGTGKGWLTAEYAMLPASTGSRKARDGVKRDGRGVEISRLIGRALRQAVDLTRLGERTITIDCDVLEADGGTRTASVTGGFVALALAVDGLIAGGKLFDSPIARQIAAVSAGIVDGEPVLDLCYAEDSRADTDMNIIMDGQGNFVEIQGTAEGAAFSRAQLDSLLDLAREGTRALMAAQREALGPAARWIAPGRPRLLVATNNAHKVGEVRRILMDLFDVVSLKEAGIDVDVEENGTTFAENAAIKAETVMRLTGAPTLADDSGLSVDALGGEPGIHSARYAGVHGDDTANNRLLVSRLRDKPRPWTAHFTCAIALARPGRETLVVEAISKGEVIPEARVENGFGYDPIFQHESGETFAEMRPEAKDAVSHRGRAMEAFRRAMAEEGA